MAQHQLLLSHLLNMWKQAEKTVKIKALYNTPKQQIYESCIF